MSTLRINNIEAQSVPASPTIDEKVKVTNSSGDILVNIDGKTSGITTIGINTTDGNIKFDANSNVLITGILTATTLAGNFTPDSLEIGSNIKLGNAGVITATSFVGSGANLTSLPAQVTIANNADNRVITGGSGVNLNGEANLTFDGSTLGIAGAATLGNGSGLNWGDTSARIRGESGASGLLRFDTNGGERLRIGSDGVLITYGTGAVNAEFNTSNSSGAYFKFDLSASGATTGFMGAGGQIVTGAAAADFGIRSQSNMVFSTGGSTERLRISSNGNIGIGNRTSSPDQLLHVHTASGDSVIHVEAAADPKLRLRAHSGESIIQFADASSSNTGEINYVHSGDYLKFRVNAAERMRINNYGLVTRPFQYHLHADRTGHLTGYDAGGSFGTPMIFNQIVSETKDSSLSTCFNTSNGLFTAPVTGVYIFNAAAYTSIIRAFVILFFFTRSFKYPSATDSFPVL